MLELSRLSKLLVAALFASGCVISPYDGQNIGANSSLFNINGYADSAGAPLTIEAYDFVDGTWDPIGAATSNSTASFAAGYFSYNSPALYFFGTSVQVANPADPLSYQHWQGSHAIVRVANNANNINLVGGPYGATGCFFSTIGPSMDFYATAWNCGYQNAEIDLYYTP